MSEVALNKIQIFTFMYVFNGISSQSIATVPYVGKKGGVSCCNMEEYFVCNDGTVSQSRRVCVTDENLDSEFMNNRLRNSNLPPVDFRNPGEHSMTFSY